jgi:hypothetical protein
VAPPSAWEEIRDSFLSLTSGAVGRWLRLPLLITALFVAHLAVLSLVYAPSGVFAWALIASLPWLYVRRVRAARSCLLHAVVGGPAPASLPSSGGVGRVASLLSLREAFLAISQRDSLLAEVALRGVDREDLGAWESRVYEAVRVLVCLDRGEEGRAAQLAPLALPTGDAALDRRLGLLMVRASWEDTTRLSAIERGLFLAGGALHDLVLLCRVRIEELSQGEVSTRFSSRVCRRVCVAASEVGDERFATTLMASAASQGAYR